MLRVTFPKHSSATNNGAVFDLNSEVGIRNPELW